MREITSAEISDIVEKLFLRAMIFLPPDVAMAIELASETETGEAGQKILEKLMEDYSCAAQSRRPIISDNPMAVVFADVGQQVHITGGLLEDAIAQGVHRVRGGAPTAIYTRLVAGESIRIKLAPTDIDAEDMCAISIFPPAACNETVENFILEAVSRVGDMSVFPVILGVGLGGTVERCALNARIALNRPVDRRNRNPDYRDMERRLLAKLNRLNIGPRGVGGSTTALAVNIEACDTHTAYMPCVVEISSHFVRRAVWII